ncbi:MAG TPA: efflux RND transporter periplasmic adaptor subunit [Thermoanaerobaculia bacterium]
MVYRRSIRTLLAVLAPAALAALAALEVTAAGCAGARAEPVADLAARRGDFRQRVLLTGSLESERSTELKVPQTPVWQLELRAIVRDGTPVAAGQPVAEFDNSHFTSDLEEKRLSAAEKRNDIVRQRAEGESADAEKAFAVEEKRAAADKARVKAAVPHGLLSERDYEDRQLDLRRAEVELAKAEADREAHRRASAADLELKQIELAKAEREISTAESAVTTLVLRAPLAGIAFVADHPWEGRKVREGDTLYPGQTVVSLPDLSSLAVEAALSDVDDGRLRPGMPARLTLDAYPDRSYAGRVTAVSPAARESARSSLLRTFQVKVELLEKDLARMRPGMSVKVEALGPEQAGVLLAPRAALDLAAAPPRALLAPGGSAAVRLGSCDALACVVLAGLAPGDRLRPARAFSPAETGSADRRRDDAAGAGAQ